MKILKLTKNVERALLGGRRMRDEEAHRVAARIIADVRKRGDAGIREWTEQLDGVDLRAGMWVSAGEIEKAASGVAKETRLAIEHAGRNIRAVAERQLPHGWTLEVEPGVNISQVVRPIEAIGCYAPGGRFSFL
jgi:histidinol dehydrogenase